MYRHRAMSIASTPMTATGRAGAKVTASAETRAGHLIRGFLEQQDARSRTYERFNAAHVELIAGTNDSERAYVDVATAVTGEMKKISEEVRERERERRRA